MPNTNGASADALQRVKNEIAARDIEFLFTQFVDMHGKPCAKLVPVALLESVLEDGAGFAGFAAGHMGQRAHDPDLEAIPDLDSFTPLPWRPGIARLACDIQVGGEDWPYCPRTILRNQLDRAAALGYEFKIGIELEYFLCRLLPDGTLVVADDLDTMTKPCYDMRAITRGLDFVTQIARSIEELGWGAGANDHEDANGQFEHNWDFADALTTCDRAIFFRYMVEALAQERGMIATFMPKPFADRTGNGCHMHLSLWKDGVNVFHADPADDPRGLGLSPLAYNFLGGLKQHARAYIAVTAPTVTSYKRLVVGETAVGGATWAPVDISYGANNRTQMLRIPGPGRIEDRTVDGSCNPYLGAAAILAAGLDGIEHGADPGEPTSELNLHELTSAQRAEMNIERLPANLLDATRELERNDVMRAALGRGRDEDYVDYFVRAKREEWEQAHNQITKWELEHYLQLY